MLFNLDIKFIFILKINKIRLRYNTLKNYKFYLGVNKKKLLTYLLCSYISTTVFLITIGGDLRIMILDQQVTEVQPIKLTLIRV